MPINGNSFVKDEKTGYLVPAHNTGSITFGVESKQRFLKVMEESGSVTEACDLLGISTRTYYQHMELDEAFARDVTISIRRMASKLEGTMFKNGQRPQGYMDRITWLRRWFPAEWTPKTSVSIISRDPENIDSLFAALRGQGKLVDVDSVSNTSNPPAV